MLDRFLNIVCALLLLLILKPVATSVVAQSLESAHNLYENGQIEEAAQAFDVLMQKIQEQEHPDPEEFFLISFFGGSSHLRLNNPVKATDYFIRAILAYDELEGVNIQWLFWSKQGLSEAYKQKGNLQNAVKHLQNLLALIENHGAKDSRLYQETIRNLAEIFEEKGKYDAAVDQYILLFEILDDQDPENNRELFRVLVKLEGLYEETDNPSGLIESSRRKIDLMHELDDMPEDLIGHSAFLLAQEYERESD
ncbi:MAG: hypothetical protein ACNA78_11215, partial [Balneolaceae bacterium]